MKYIDFKKLIQKPYFSRADMRLRKMRVYDYQLTLWRKNGYIEPLKRGLYVFTEHKQDIKPEEFSFLLYEPSYLSLEYALHQYGFIPEMVAVFTAVTTRPTRTTQNQFGRFYYRTIAPHLFFGYDARETAHGKYLVAHPEKALLDYFYLNPRTMRTKQDLEEARFNCDALTETINRKRLKEYLVVFHSKRLDNLMRLLFELCSHSRS